MSNLTKNEKARIRICLVEGLGSFKRGKYVQKAFGFLEDRGYTNVDAIPYTDAGSLVNVPYYHIIISHSFGAGYVIKANPHCDLLITMDARRWDFWNNKKMVSPSNAKKHLNFYQKSLFLSGYGVKDADANNSMKKSHHTSLPEDCREDIFLAIIMASNKIKSRGL